MERALKSLTVKSGSQSRPSNDCLSAAPLDRSFTAARARLHLGQVTVAPRRPHGCAALAAFIAPLLQLAAPFEEEGHLAST
ncbi:hypothetical protein K0M31_012387, partial [Melipona bicolor]